MTARIIIMGAAGRHFHNFNTVYRDDAASRVVAFTATQIPNIDGRRYPKQLAGPLYPEGVPIYPESELLFDDRIAAVASPGFAARHKVKQAKDMASLPLLSVEGVDWTWTTWSDFLRATGAPHRKLGLRRFNSYVIALQAAQDGQGLALGWMKRPPHTSRRLRYWTDYCGGSASGCTCATSNQMRNDIKAAVNGTDGQSDGAGIMQFVGHGNFDVWSDDAFFDNRSPALDTDDLLNAGRQPMLFVHNCLSSGFMSTATRSLGEDWQKKSDGGAIAVFAPSGAQADRSRCDRWFGGAALRSAGCTAGFLARLDPARAHDCR